MIVEWLQSLTTPCPAPWRQMGFLREAIGINARYSRNKTAWQSHLKHSRTAVLTAADNCPKKRKVVLLGAAAVHDLPVAELADMFDEVVLVDLFHLWRARWLAFRQPNITLVACDLTASLETIWRGNTDITKPTVFIDDPAIDLVVSGNIASQLPLLALSWLKRKSSLTEDACQHVGRDLISAHFNWLSGFRGTVCLITDRERLTFDSEGREVHRESALFDVPSPAANNEWVWEIAPPGEINNKVARSHIVISSILGQNSP